MFLKTMEQIKDTRGINKKIARNAVPILSSTLQYFLSLGSFPLSNSYLTKITSEGDIYPRGLCLCYFLVQLQEFETTENIFYDYTYFSSYSET
jgi:hypothetical protein